MAKNKRKIRVGQDAYQDSYDSKDKGGVTRKQALSFKDKVKFFEVREGVNRINIIPYEIKTKDHPAVKAGKAKVGDYRYNLDLFIHQYVGPEKADVICPKRNFGKPCPICDEANKLLDSGKKKEAEALYAKRKAIYNVEPIVKGESQGLQIFIASHALFEKELIGEAHACENGEDIITFANTDDGKVVKFRASEEAFGKNKYFEYKSFSFEDREEEIDEEILDNAVSLDEAMVVLSYEEIEKIFFGIPEDEEEEEDERPKKKKAPADEEEDEEEEQPRKKKRLVDEDEEEEESEKPKKKKKDEDNPFDDSDIPFDTDEKPKKDKKNKCPHGYNYGKDADEYKECKKCKLWDDCLEGA